MGRGLPERSTWVWLGGRATRPTCRSGCPEESGGGAHAVWENRNMRRFSFVLALALPACADEPCRDADPGLVCRVAGTAEMGFNGDGKPPVDTDLYLVSEARRGPDGRIYLM